jgi:hypothetical protein
MKKNLILLAAILFLSAGECYSQKFLKKLTEGIENVSKVVDEVLQVPASEETAGNVSQSTNPNYAGTIITCSDKNLDIQLESCIRNAATGTVTIAYLVKNNGPSLKISSLGQSNLAGSPQITGFYDNLGNSYKWREITLGNSRPAGNSSINSVTIPEGVSLKGTIEIANVDRNAQAFTLVMMAGWEPFFFSFKNLPIHTEENVKQVSATTTGINISKTTGLLDAGDDWSKYWNRPVVSVAKRNSMQIDKINDNDLKSSLQHGGKIAEGKTIYTGDAGRIETFFVIIPDHRLYEYLISYNAAGNYVDCINISLRGYGDYTSSTIEGNTILWESQWEEGKTTKGYTITPELKFSQFKEESETFEQEW